MSKFDLIKIEQVNGRTPFFKLSIDGYVQFDEFYKEFIRNGSFRSKFNACFQIMNYVSDGHLVPNTKFRMIESPDEPVEVQEFEIKKDEIRIYTVKVNSGFIVILCAYKSKKQKKDIVKFRSIKKALLNFLQLTI